MVLLGLMIDVKEVICGDPECSPIDTLVTIGEIEVPFLSIRSRTLSGFKYEYFALYDIILNEHAKVF